MKFNESSKKKSFEVYSYIFVDWCLKIFNISNTNDDILFSDEYYLGDLRGNREKAGKQMG